VPSERVRLINTEPSKETYYSANPDDVLGVLIGGSERDAIKKLGEDMARFTVTENAAAYASSLLISMCKTAKSAGVNMESLFDDTLSAINNAYDINTIELLCRECIELYVKLTEKVKDWENAAVSDEVVNYVLKHYNENLTLSSISKSLHLNAGLISRTIKSSTGMKFNSYLNFVRIQNAKRLLLVSSTTITNIAEAVGYNDYYYFISKFKSLMGELPSEYRKNHEMKRGGEQCMAL
jgi:two-component system response regulator YesN